ncbi:TerC family protein [Thermoflexibacter ruber]|uniref:Membrane protein TerC, possibly involved in tellurium resistance n=1 Tax=Thermoflexibacter ruber TaxID=1003 RepID=A0A1I2C9J2_9BACT|nr:TerC family protein [Thermoflexibacter ruber]SFE64934.1 Membrane protein TerC, possibly involved in tellurium resistance [Thermoflexibacter ruber]
MFDALFTTQGLISLLTLTALEIVLGIDNIIFISIIADKLPESSRKSARLVGLCCALIVRIFLLFTITWIIGLKEDLFVIKIEALEIYTGISVRDLILFFGGLFLMGKSTSEIHAKMEEVENEGLIEKKKASFFVVIIQIVLVDIVFSFDSILTAIGLVPPEQVGIMISAVVVSMGVMMLAVGKISDFVNQHPTIKMLALSFLIMIGMLLVGESVDFHIPKGYIYFAMAFAFSMEMLNIRLRKKAAANMAKRTVATKITTEDLKANNIEQAKEEFTQEQL